MALFVGMKINPLQFEKMPLLDFYFYSDYASDILENQQKEMEENLKPKDKTPMMPFNPVANQFPM